MKRGYVNVLNNLAKVLFSLAFLDFNSGSIVYEMVIERGRYTIEQIPQVIRRVKESRLLDKLN